MKPPITNTPQRKILFRGRGLENRRWYFGNLITSPGNAHYIHDPYRSPDPKACIKIDPATIGQATDSLDADNHTIYEDDLVIFNTDGSRNKTLQVVYRLGAFLIVGEDYRQFLANIDTRKLLIIGNIYEQ